MLRLMSVLRASLVFSTAVSPLNVACKEQAAGGDTERPILANCRGRPVLLWSPRSAGAIPDRAVRGLRRRRLTSSSSLSLRDQQRKRLSRLTTWSLSDETVAAVPRTLHLGRDDPWLCRHWLHDISSITQSCDGFNQRNLGRPLPLGGILLAT